jgi:hypothetical protein
MPRIVILALVALAAASPAFATAKVSAAALIAAAKAAPLASVDESRKDCDDRRTVSEWLAAAIAPTARSITWKGGKCVLVIPENPLDAGGDWCAHADILPRKGKKSATIEVYLEDPVGGRPGVPYAFRAVTDLRDGDGDYTRDTVSFEYEWRQAHEPQFDDATRICAPTEERAE